MHPDLKIKKNKHNVSIITRNEYRTKDPSGSLSIMDKNKIIA